MADSPCADWNAWIDLMPGVDPTLHVTASCEMPTTGFEVSLTRHEPQGENRRDLLLDLEIKEPTGNVSEVITKVPAEYTEGVEGADFDTVSILPDGPAGVEVTITQ
jgi:hypothetical protein